MGIKGTISLAILLVCIALMSACGGQSIDQVDKLNEISYAFHYRNLDSTKHYAQRALQLAGGYDAGAAEALNNFAFVSLAKMQYGQTAQLLESIERKTDNQVELLIADVQQMRLCQRQSRNKDFYDYRERANKRLERLEREYDDLNEHQRKRLIYAKSELCIVASAYFYYVGLFDESISALKEIENYTDIQEDTAQLLNYWYNMGAGGIITGKTLVNIDQREFDYLLRCYLLARQYNYPYWEAQSMQSMSEHLQDAKRRKILIQNNFPAMKFINIDQIPDSLLAGNLAQRALNIFKAYGDVYQTAGANRTLAECYWQIKDYDSALICLNNALNENKSINQAPDLVASIREQLSLVYSAVDDKSNSDLNRNLYLDLQEQTRQDRQLEARASQLSRSSKQLNLMLGAVIFMIVVVIVLLFVFSQMRRRNDTLFSLNTLLEPLREWRKKNEERSAEVQEHYDEIQEQMGVMRLHLQQNKRRNLEQRAKVQLVNSIQPFIDRMMNEVNRLQEKQESEEIRRQRYQYIVELTDTINEYNDVLTQWIQMRQGEISLKIESFPLQPLFDIVSRARMGFKLKGVNLKVEKTTNVVKADKTLTLFMINTIADNARKFTPEGGTVTVSSVETPDYVEISVKDTGEGMTEEKLSHIFDRTYMGGHGYGLKNCNGIIEKYKKVSRIFHVCAIKAESEVGKGTRIFFRLPKGIVRLLVVCMMLGSGAVMASELPSDSIPSLNTPVRSARALGKAARFADSAYYSNVSGTYERTLQFADSCHKYLAANDTATLLDISNETAVATLALHKWELYRKNNSVFTRLFREASADQSLPEYVRMMQRSRNNKSVAITLLILLLIIIFPAYYFLYYRHRLNYQFCIDRINAMNKLLLEDTTDEEKLKGIDKLGDFRRFNLSDEQQANLNQIVTQIRNALHVSIENTNSQETSIELAEDDLRRLEMDTARLHVSNNVLDNCLSTLKHETMYFPSRIRQLVDGTDENLKAISELTSYYQELYHILSLQAMNQVTTLPLDKGMIDYLFEILKKLNKGEKPRVEVSDAGDQYVQVNVDMLCLHLTDEQCRELFTARTTDMSYLLCRQIVREIGETTNLRGSGIRAEKSEDGAIRIVITLPKRSIPHLVPSAKELSQSMEPVNRSII